MNLAERFARDRGAPQVVDGVTVHNSFRHTVMRGSRVHIRRLAATTSAVQGLRVKLLKGGFLRVNNQRSKEVVLWADTSPEDLEILCAPSTETAEFIAWNCWRDAKGIMQAWIGDAGIVIEGSDNTFLLRCSAGYHRFSPTDLDIELRFQ